MSDERFVSITSDGEQVSGVVVRRGDRHQIVRTDDGRWARVDLWRGRITWLGPSSTPAAGAAGEVGPSPGA